MNTNQTTKGHTMNETITINGVEYVRKDAVAQVAPVNLTNYSIIRCRNAGVHFGCVIERDANRILVEGSRRLWRWWSKATLSELAMEGPLPSKISEQKYGCTLPRLELTPSDVCEIIPCTAVAAGAILAVPVWEAAS
jgi:hypothetical protein